MLGPPRTAVLVAAVVLGALQMLVFVTWLIRIVQRARQTGVAADGPSRPVRRRMFLSNLGVVTGAWLFTYGLLSLVLGV